MSVTDEGTGKISVERSEGCQGQTRAPSVLLHCLTKLSGSEKAAYRKEFGDDSNEIKFIDWAHEKDGDMDDMYRIWEENKRKDCRGNYHFSFFLDRIGVKDTSVILAQPDVYTLCHTEEATSWGQGLINKELAANGEEPNSILVYDALGDDQRILEDALGRALTYGRIPAASLYLAWCNLDIANMDMRELVELENDSATPGGSVDGVVHMLRNKNWDIEEAFGKRLYEFIKNTDGPVTFTKASDLDEGTNLH